MFMKFIIPILLLFIFVSCDIKPKIESQVEYKTHNLSFFDGSVQLPKEYKLIKAEELIKKYESMNLGTSQEVQYLKSVESNSYASVIFYDTTNFINTFIFQEGEHVIIDKISAQLYLGMIEKDLQNMWLQNDISYERIKSKFYNKPNIQIITIQYKVSKNEISKYISQYIISSNSKTMAVTITNLSNLDFGDIIKSIKIKN